MLGAVGFWAAQIGILWASFKAFGVDVPLAVVVQAFFLGMLANLIPLPGGVGGVDAGLLGAFALFGVSHVFAPVLLYRVLAFWLPIPPGDRRLPPAAKDRPAGGSRLATERRDGVGEQAPGPRHYFIK